VSSWLSAVKHCHILYPQYISDWCEHVFALIVDTSLCLHYDMEASQLKGYLLDYFDWKLKVLRCVCALMGDVTSVLHEKKNYKI